MRYGYLKHLGEFTYPEAMTPACGSKVVIQSNRGIETGELVCVQCPTCGRHVSDEQIKIYKDNSGADSYLLGNGRILREATIDDLVEEAKLRAKALSMKRMAQQFANRNGVALKMVDCEHLLGGDRIIFYFTADGRIDFRALVKDLSQELQTRVKMHQVGARDEARLVADFETCGREVCCKTLLKTLKPVTMRMAKLQRSTLDPAKVSGRCGRLKCCLRYEHQSYESLDSEIPKVGEKIETAHGFGTVVKRQILTQLVHIALARDGGPLTVALEDVVRRNLKEFPAAPVVVAPKTETRRTEVVGKSADSPQRSQARSRSGRRRRPKAAQQSPPAKEQAEPRSPNVVGNVAEEPRRPQRRRRGRRRRRPGGSGGSGGSGKRPSKRR